MRDSSSNYRRVFVSTFVITFFIVIILIFVHMWMLVGQQNAIAAEDNLKETFGQIAHSLNTAVESDAANLQEIASVLANTENKDTVMQGINKNDMVFRYLFVPREATEGVASDGTNLQRNDTHQFSSHVFVPDVEVSEAFLSASGNWSYLYRCPVVKDGETYGWIYAQYLFDRVHKLVTDKLYGGQGNFFLYDYKTNTIVYQQDDDTYASVVGQTLDNFALNVLGTKESDVTQMKATMSRLEESVVHDMMNDVNTIIYLAPIEGGDYYLMGIAIEEAVVREAESVRMSVIVGLVTTILVGAISLFFYFLYLSKQKAKEEFAQAQAEHTRELEKAYEAAMAANEAKSYFLENMSHELKTPINAVLGMNEMIIRESSQPKITDYAQDIKTAAQTLLFMVNDILDVTQIESGYKKLKPVEYMPYTLFHTVTKVIKADADAKGISLNLEYGEDIPYRLYGDEMRIRQIVINLLTNSIKYTNDGGVTLRVTGHTVEDKFSLSVEVIDTGIGIKEEDIPLLMEKFIRIEQSRNRNIAGTGLGLNLVAGLLELMGGELKVSSVYGEGSVFSFEILQPIMDATPIRVVNSQNTRKKDIPNSIVAPNARILIVDDNPINLKVASKLLQATKAQVDTAMSGFECLEMVTQTPYDLIFMDQMMPELDGTETLHRIREMDLAAQPPIVVLTADDVLGARDKYLEAGFDDYLSKPVRYIILEKAIKDFVPADKIREI